MRDYSVARTIFSFIEFVFWCGVVVGLIITFTSMGVASRGFGAAPGVVAAIPGIVITLFSLFGVASIQDGRASVDSAEYGQQALKIARDQLELSRQAMRQGQEAQQSFAALAKQLAARDGVVSGENEGLVGGASYSQSTPAPTASKEVLPTAYAPEQGTNPNVRAELLTYEIKGKTLTQYPDGTFDLDGERFATMEDVNKRLRI